MRSDAYGGVCSERERWWWGTPSASGEFCSPRGPGSLFGVALVTLAVSAVVLGGGV